MKKTLKLIPALLMALMMFALPSCSDDDSDKPISESDLPSISKTFLDTYYSGVNVVKVYKDKTDYDVMLANGHEVEFDLAGNWVDVDAPAGQTIPSGFYPSAIDTYVNSIATSGGINEISKLSAGGYEVEPVYGPDMIFDANGNFVTADY